MSLFQNSVITKYANLQNKETIAEKWNVYKSHFLNPEIQENIKNSKEEQYQGEFLIDLFVNVLGYIKSPTPNFNLITEIKNEKDGKKADGGIIINDKVVGVIELKGTNTTDLQKIEVQAFGYKNNQKDCIYVITSNFEKLRFYIENAIEYKEFNLFSLTQKEFEIMYLCLAFENILHNIPKKLKDESLSQEDLITKQLYKDYSLFKRELFQNLLLLNPQFEALELFKKSQKLLDRFLFLLFAEDRQLLPPNSVRLILQQWKQLKELDEYKPLYDRFKKYFGYLNTGYKGKQYDVYAYNGGLFQADDILDNITIDDEILYRNTLKLSEYDFSSEVDVNILGHIFENSLNELDEIKAQLEGNEVNKSATKRKKDGVFYTPKYITKYIVENTVGKLCTEKKAELQIVEEEYFTDKKRQLQTKKNLLDKLTNYRDWLLKITIVDPACGSGAFLNEALNFLIAEHKYIDELEVKLLGGGMIFPNVENSILENNLFGVDINEESVEIAKLSLWLRTAQPNRKLNDLSNNIKCGNSLIDDPEVAGDKAFCWEKEFPTVFANGGFDVVIGNPPYGVSFNEFEKNFLSSFDKLVPDFEIYIYFISIYKVVLKKHGLMSYIFPNTFLSTVFGKKYRESILRNVNVYQIIDLSNDNTFSDASVRTCIFSFVNNQQDNYESLLFKLINKEFAKIITCEKKELIKHSENLLSLFSQNPYEKKIIAKISSHDVLKEYHEVSQGLIPYDKYRGHDEYTIKNRIWHSNFQKDESFKRELKGGDINRYNIQWNGQLWIKYGEWLAAPRNVKFFISERLLVREIISRKMFCCYTSEEFYNTPSAINIVDETKSVMLKYTMTIINSSLIGWFINKTSPKANKGLFPKILVNDVRNIPIVKTPIESQQPFIEKADLMLTLNKELQEELQKFRNNVQREFGLDDLSTKLQNWHLLSYSEFLKEIEKKKVKLSLSQKAEWEEYFTTEHKKANEIKSQIEQTDKEIDQMVYALYGLTEEEIEIVERSF
ncbi:MAG: N-6 DNA methylase [Bacteroidales bacterium]|nr:N-6 DNA methylase [Bacteroidales bacterium]